MRLNIANLKLTRLFILLEMGTVVDRANILAQMPGGTNRIHLTNPPLVRPSPSTLQQEGISQSHVNLHTFVLELWSWEMFCRRWFVLYQISATDWTRHTEGCLFDMQIK